MTAGEWTGEQCQINDPVRRWDSEFLDTLFLGIGYVVSQEVLAVLGTRLGAELEAKNT